jgi:hypothetical protein
MLSRLTRLSRVSTVIRRTSSGGSTRPMVLDPQLERLDPYVPVWDPENDPFENPHFGKEKRDVLLPDKMGAAVGYERLEMLLDYYGIDDPTKELDIGYCFSKKATREHPNIFASNGSNKERLLICKCDEPNMALQMLEGFTQRCQCGHFVRLMPFDEYWPEMNKRISDVLKSMHGTPDYVKYHKQLKEYYDKIEKIETECLAIQNEQSNEGQKKLDELADLHDNIKSLRRSFFLKHVQQNL